MTSNNYTSRRITTGFPWHLEQFDKHFIGYDDLTKMFTEALSSTTNSGNNYPPYNILKISDTKYCIEMAVAGFNKNEIEIIVENNKLVVTGTSKVETNKNSYLFKGIADRNFNRQFTLADNILISGAEINNGILKIALERVIPETHKSKKIDIK
jgi:molecular chaperone IbpA